jgi:5-methylcytosine-specific restriction endonuclease McrA
MSKQHWDGWYKLAVWKRRRAFQLAACPLCAICQAQGRSTAATVVDHVVPHRGDWNLFKLGELQSLCVNCHNNAKQSIETRGYDKTIGLDGLPVDKRHPVYTRTMRKPEAPKPALPDVTKLIS